MAYSIEQAHRRVRKRLDGTSRYVYGLGKDLARVQGRIDCGNYAASVVSGELIPERDRLRLKIDTEKAYAERDCLNIAEQYRHRSHDNAGADSMIEGITDYVEQQMGGKNALDLLPLYFETGNETE